VEFGENAAGRVAREAGGDLLSVRDGAASKSRPDRKKGLLF
jgi:hypothetical protein